MKVSPWHQYSLVFLVNWISFNMFCCNWTLPMLYWFSIVDASAHKGAASKNKGWESLLQLIFNYNSKMLTDVSKLVGEPYFVSGSDGFFFARIYCIDVIRNYAFLGKMWKYDTFCSKQIRVKNKIENLFLLEAIVINIILVATIFVTDS